MAENQHQDEQNELTPENKGFLSNFSESLNTSHLAQTAISLVVGLSIGHLIGKAIVDAATEFFDKEQDNHVEIHAPTFADKSIAGSQDQLIGQFGDKISFPETTATNTAEIDNVIKAMDTPYRLGTVDEDTGTTIITYTFDSLESAFTKEGDDNNGQKDFALLTEEERDLVRADFAHKESYANIDYVEVSTENPDDVSLTIRKADLSEYKRKKDVHTTTEGSQGYARYPIGGVSHIVLDTEHSLDNNTISHENLHALGFAHPHRDKEDTNRFSLAPHLDSINTTHLSYQNSDHSKAGGLITQREGDLERTDDGIYDKFSFNPNMALTPS